MHLYLIIKLSLYVLLIIWWAQCLVVLKKCVIGLPGGCPLGPRPIDQHIKGFKALGAEIDESSNTSMKLVAKELRGAHIFLDMVSVGATINIMLAAVHAKGQTVIDNAAKEPEVVDVANFLMSMGADIRGAGTTSIKINGVEELKGSEYQIIPDRIEAGSYMCMAAAMGERSFYIILFLNMLKL